MSLLTGALGSGACLSCVFVVHSFFKVCIACEVCAADRDCWARVVSRNLFGAIVSVSWVYGGFLDLGEQRVLLAVGTCRARLLFTRALLFILRSGNKNVRPGIRGSVVSSQRSSGTEVQCKFWVWSRCVWCLFSGASASTCATKSTSRSISTAFPVPSTLSVETENWQTIWHVWRW